jgi:glutathione S-transferase
LEEAKLPFTATRASSNFFNIDDSAGDEGMAALRTFNPKGTVPTLVVDDVVLTETIATLAYVAHAGPEAKLLPANLLDEARCMATMAWFASTVHIAFRKANRPYRFSADTAAHADIQAFGRDEVWTYMQEIDEMLQGNTWMMGEEFSIVDCHAFNFWRWAVLAEYPVQSLTSFSRFSEQMLARPSVKRALEREESGMQM